MKKLLVRSSRTTYTVVFIKNLQSTLEELNKKNKLHILIDKNVFYLFKRFFKNKRIYESFKIIDTIEENKDIYQPAKYIEYLVKNKIHKDHKLVVIGGGLVQDIGSFTAHILLRGIDWIFIPTTLLAMADSCIGSKSGINVGKYKNQVGAFHPPSDIYIYLSFLDSLSENEIINGVGEIIKHVLIKGGKEFENIIKNISNVPKNKKITEKIIYQSLLIKKEIIEEDEFEKYMRKVLNYGHTFGHALEGYTKHNIPHGISILIGMDIANYISVKKQLLNFSNFEKIHKLIAQYINSYKINISDYDIYMDYLLHDKKVEDDRVYLILSRGIGKIVIIKTILDGKFKKYIKEYFDKYGN